MNDKFINELEAIIKPHKDEPACVEGWYKRYENRSIFKDKFKNIGCKAFQEEARFLIDSFKGELSREQIFIFMEEDKYRGFVAAMLWGGLGLPPMGTKCLDDAMNIDPDEIREKIHSIELFLNTGDTREAFVSCSTGGKNKLPGIGISFFTKIMFFLSSNKISPRPLIYDSKMQLFHCALIKNDTCLNDFFQINSFSVTDSYISLQGGHNDWKSVDFYMDYIERMKMLSERISSVLGNAGRQGNEGRLEELMFDTDIQNWIRLKK